MSGKKPRKPKTLRTFQEISRVYPVRKILKEKTELSRLLCLTFENQLLDAKLFEEFSGFLFRTLPVRTELDVVIQSVRYLVGTVLTKKEIDEVSWRLSGNLPTLRNLQPVTPWRVQTVCEWVPMQIVASRRLAEYGKRGALFSFQILAGSPCPLIIQKWWSIKHCLYLARQFGFTTPWQLDRGKTGLVFSVPEQFVSLRVLGKIDPNYCEREPAFSELRWSSAIAEHNDEIHKLRARQLPGYECPRKFPASFPCHLCPVGQRVCPAATHRRNWTLGTCPECNQDNALFDPELPAKVCVRCYGKIAYRH